MITTGVKKIFSTTGTKNIVSLSGSIPVQISTTPESEFYLLIDSLHYLLIDSTHKLNING